MLGRCGVEAIGRQILITLEQPKAALRHDQVQKAQLLADRAVAGLSQVGLGSEIGLKADRAAVTPPGAPGDLAALPGLA
jgi:hypothetical protein